MAKDDVRNSIKLASVDDLFSTEESRAEAKSEKIIIVPAEDVHPYVRQPYQTARLTQDLVEKFYLSKLRPIGLNLAFR